MAGPRCLRFRANLVAHNPMNCRIGKLYSVLLGEPLLNLGVTAKALRLGEPIFQGLDHLRWNRLLAGLRPWVSHLLDLLNTPFFVKFEPVGNSVAMDIQLAGRFGFWPRPFSEEEASGSGAGFGRLFPCEQAAQAARPTR